MADHERVLFTVDKIRAEDNFGTYFANEIVKRFIFRTRKAANDFRIEMNKRTKNFKYSAPQRCVWGPDN